MPESRPLPASCMEGPVAEVARRLLGAVLASSVDGVTATGRIVEVEAYGASDDPASHAAVRAGRTRRNGAMFGPPGTAYVYRSYGIHWCVNVVCGVEGEAAAVLVRAIEPLQGSDAMVVRRGRADALTNGPGRLCQALGITGALDGHPLGEPPLTLLEGVRVQPDEMGVSGRIGVSRGAELPLRFFITGNRHLSRPGGIATLV